MAEAPTQTVVDGRYRVLDRIGSGGMGDVYRAEDSQLDREVAIKVLHRRFARDAQFVERFRREASSAASLQHPNVVSVFDRGEYDGTYYIAMEYLGGRTLKQLIADEAPLPQERAIDLGIEILQAAAFAHRNGLVHRDFKPQNVIVDENDGVKVTDFGIARAGASEITETGSILGTAQYLSPEQAQGEAVAAASDLYSIGVILYELLAGRLPFEGESAVAVAVKHVSEEPVRLSVVRPDIHPALEAAVMRALVKDPRHRFGAAEELISALQSARAQIAMGDEGYGTAVWGPLPAAPPDDELGRRRRRWPWIAAALLLAAAGIAAFLLLRGPGDVVVPEVIGEQLRDVQPRLEAMELEVEVEEERDFAPLNEVIEQEPPAGDEIERGSTVTLIVSRGPADVKIPDVLGLSEQRAIEKLNRRDLSAETVERVPSADVPQGSVIESSPPPGEMVPERSTVELTVSDGPRQVDVPSVVGTTEDAAIATLEGAGLVPSVEEVESSQSVGEVLSQDPGAGAVVDEGTTVTIAVSLGPAPEPETATVPGVIGLSSDAAQSRIAGAGFDVAVAEEPTEDQASDGVVIGQDPGGGAEVEVGSTVTIVVGVLEEPAEETPPAEDDVPGPGTDPSPPPDGGPPPQQGGGRRLLPGR